MRVICRPKPEWGLGQVLSDDGGAKVTEVAKQLREKGYGVWQH